jgi:tetratricopeptide (TPR) repeat protein
MKTPLIIGLVGCCALFGLKSQDMRDEANPPVRIVGLTAQDTHAAASLLGQFRTSLSSNLFLRADMYLHNGVSMRPLTQDEIKAGRKGVGSNPNEQKLHDDTKIVTVVPSKDLDFRGLDGDVERAVASYKDMTGHSHNNPTQALPLYRLMTWLDPQFIQGWTTGAFVILWDKKKGSVEKSIEFLNQGLENNPKSIDILTEIAYANLRTFPDLGLPERRFKTAIRFLETARTVGVENFKLLSDSEKEALIENYRRLAVSYRETSQYEKMLQVALEAKQYFPEDGPLKAHLDAALKLVKGEKVMVNGVELVANPDVGL